MPKATVRLTFRGEVFNEPVIYQVGRNHNVVTNIRRAHVEAGEGFLDLDLEGEAQDIEDALAFCTERGIQVERL